MEAKLRHDLRHPLATISMIASTISAFGDGVDRETIDSYRRQVVLERDELRRLAEEHQMDFPFDDLDVLIEAFSQGPDAQNAGSLDQACQALISDLSSGRFDGS